MSPAGYSGTPLARKLGIAAGASVLIQGAPTGFRTLLDALPEGVRFQRRLTSETDLVLLFHKRRQDLTTRLRSARRALRPDAAVWVSWPKKSSGVATDITEDTIREIALPLGFVDVKVCAVDEVWSGLKLVVRKELR